MGSVPYTKLLITDPHPGMENKEFLIWILEWKYRILDLDPELTFELQII